MFLVGASKSVLVSFPFWKRAVEQDKAGLNILKPRS